MHCGLECNEDASICPNCGALVDNYVDNKTYMNVYHINHGKKIRNKKLIWWFLLGAILPYVGFLVSWYFYYGEREKARAVLLGAIISTIITTLLSYIIPLFFINDNNGNGNPSDSENKGQQIKNLIEIYKCL